MPIGRTTLTILFALLLVASGLPVQATPAPDPTEGSELPTPGLFCEEARTATGRLFPEAMETNDFVSYDEARCGLSVLEEEHPDRIEVRSLGQSFGWENHRTGEHDTSDVLLVEVTNEGSPVPREEKAKVVFMLSIHGNEKGGREGGLRVIEDLVTEKGLAERNPDLVSYLDHQVALFLFPNPDGWTHEEPEYRANDACYVSATCGWLTEAGEVGAETQNFVRVNGNGVDLNREAPTVGWQDESHTSLSEPAPRAYVPYLENLTNLKYASDIHGMLHPADSGVAFNSGSPPIACLGAESTGMEGPGEVCLREGHFVLTMLPAGQQTFTEMEKSTRLAEKIKVRLNSDAYFTEWNNAPEGGVWGGEYNDWGTVWDTIGYTDSGFSSDWFAQDTGLNVPGVDFELAYNHITFDNYYPGLSQRINAYHVETTRVIVEAFMEQTARDHRVTLQPEGRVAAVATGNVVTNEGDMNVSGWAEENPADDAYDTAHKVFRASVDQYLSELATTTRGEGITVLAPGDITAERLDDVTHLLVPGSAYERLRGDATALATLDTWVRAGGNLVVTDSALPLLTDLGIVEQGSVDHVELYAGFSNLVDRDHRLVEGVRGMARQTYEPVPLGYNIDDGGTAPVWFVERDAFDGTIVGVAGQDQSGTPDPSKVNLGEAELGNGTVVFVGAVLPNPTDAHYHPYGLDGYATTYTGNRILFNALGVREEVEVGNVTVTPNGTLAYEGLTPASTGEPVASGKDAGDAGVPGFTALAAVAAAAVALLRPRRRS